MDKEETAYSFYLIFEIPTKDFPYNEKRNF